MGTNRNEVDSLNLAWQPLESRRLAAVAYVAPRRLLYLRFHSGEPYRYFTFTAEQYREFEADSQGRFFLSHIRNHFPTNASAAASVLSQKLT